MSRVTSLPSTVRQVARELWAWLPSWRGLICLVRRQHTPPPRGPRNYCGCCGRTFYIYNPKPKPKPWDATRKSA